MATASFKRSFDSIAAIFAFTAAAASREGIDARVLPTVDLAVEELFTNMVKYNTASTADVRIDVSPIDGGAEVTITDYDADPFDVTQAPTIDVTLPIDQRQPGGLGLHLIRRLLDSIEYDYCAAQRTSRITFRKTHNGRAVTSGADRGEKDAGD